jgi:hypothetical protein
VFRHLLADVPAEQARWKPAPEKWSLLEVASHLADEERDDFRTRVDLTLHHPGRAWPSIDPPRWAVERRYNERELEPTLHDFLRERARTVEWLRSLGRVDPEAAYLHPAFGRVPAGELLASWLAHDLIHIRQMTRLHYEYHAVRSAPYGLGYAGPW